MTMLADAAAASVTGRLRDKGFTSSQISNAVGSLSGMFFAAWSTYSLFRRGAARKEFNVAPHAVHQTEAIVVFT